MTWSPQQDAALKAVGRWVRQRGGEQVFYLAGYAGTGKSTLAKSLAVDVKGRVLFGAFTGKAALVMQTKGCSGAQTVHSMIYRLEEEYHGDPTFTLNPDSAVKSAKLVIIDECSMINEALGRDLLSFGTKVLVLGDPAQLPPVKGEGFFTARQPDVMLTEVHRQAADNPIIRMSMDIREGRGLQHGAYGDSRVITREQLDQEDVLAADQVLVGLNRTRHLYNRRIRDLRGYTGEMPGEGERLVCLRNRREKGLLNGGIWSVDQLVSEDHRAIKIRVQPEDAGAVKKPVEVEVHRAFFHGTEHELSFDERRGLDEMTFGYALTTHKAQGSQWDRVMVFDESKSFREKRKEWLYTAVTRAAEVITIVM